MTTAAVEIVVVDTAVAVVVEETAIVVAETTNLKRFYHGWTQMNTDRIFN